MEPANGITAPQTDLIGMRWLKAQQFSVVYARAVQILKVGLHTTKPEAELEEELLKSLLARMASELNGTGGLLRAAVGHAAGCECATVCGPARIAIRRALTAMQAANELFRSDDGRYSLAMQFGHISTDVMARLRPAGGARAEATPPYLWELPRTPLAEQPPPLRVNRTTPVSAISADSVDTGGYT